MVLDWNAEVVDQVDAHWRGQLRPRLDGLTDDEYLWQPAPSVPTIAWRLGHVTAGLLDRLGTFEEAATADEALRGLDQAYAAWLAGVRALGDDGLARPQGPTVPPEFADAPMVRLVLYTSVEVIHHGAEVCLLRDLYLGRSGSARPN